MSGFTKLFSSILTSSVWVESDATLRVWFALLALADARGVAEGAVPGLANLCLQSIPETEAALARLAAPDPYSRSPEFEGRRIAPVPGGWQLLNYLKYREKGQAKEGSRARYMREYREAKSQGVTRNSEVLHVTQKQKQKQITETPPPLHAGEHPLPTSPSGKPQLTRGRARDAGAREARMRAREETPMGRRLNARDRLVDDGRQLLGLTFDRRERRALYERLASGETEEHIRGVWEATRAQLIALDELDVAPDEPEPDA